MGILCVSTLPFHSLLSKQDMASHAETTIVNEVRDQIYPTEKSAQVSDSILTESTENAVSDWNLILVNPWNYLPDDFSVELTELKNGHAIDQRAYPDLQDMMDAAREEGLAPLICSSYRTYEKQETLYNNRINKYLAEGYSMEKAITEAGKWVAVPAPANTRQGSPWILSQPVIRLWMKNRKILLNKSGSWKTHTNMALSCAILTIKVKLQEFIMSHGIIAMWEKKWQKKSMKKAFAWKNI